MALRMMRRAISKLCHGELVEVWHCLLRNWMMAEERQHRAAQEATRDKEHSVNILLRVGARIVLSDVRRSFLRLRLLWDATRIPLFQEHGTGSLLEGLCITSLRCILALHVYQQATPGAWADGQDHEKSSVLHAPPRGLDWHGYIDVVEKMAILEGSHFAREGGVRADVQR